MAKGRVALPSAHHGPPSLLPEPHCLTGAEQSRCLGMPNQPNSPFAHQNSEGLLPALPGVHPGATGVNGPKTTLSLQEQSSRGL